MNLSDVNDKNFITVKSDKIENNIIEKKKRGRPRGTTKENGAKYTTSSKVGRKKIYDTPEKKEKQLEDKRKKSLEIYYKKRSIILEEREKYKKKEIHINKILNEIKNYLIELDKPYIEIFEINMNKIFE